MEEALEKSNRREKDCTCKTLWTSCEKAACKYYWDSVWLSTKATSLGLRAWGERNVNVGLTGKDLNLEPQEPTEQEKETEKAICVILSLKLLLQAK